MRVPFEEFKKQHPNFKARGVEIGVWEGGNAEEVVNGLPLEKFWLVDCWGDWSSQPGVEESLGIKEDSDFWERLYTQVQERFAHYPNVEIVRLWSHEAAKQLPNDLDFVYIDGNHSYEGVAADLRLWVPKVREGGWVMGDDWNTTGVMKAVPEFVGEYNYSLQIAEANSQWWFVKGGTPVPHTSNFQFRSTAQ